MPSSIFFKLAGWSAAIQVVAVGALAGWLTWRDAQAADEALQRKAQTYGRLVGEVVRSAVAFDDQETAREVFDAVSADSDVDALALYTEKTNLLYGRGDNPPAREGAVPAELTITEAPSAVIAAVPVHSVEGPKGTLVVRLSTATVRAAIAARVRGALIAAVIALIASVIAAALVARRLTRRITTIAQVADQVAAGALDQKPIDDHKTDELGVLARGFDVMVARLRANIIETKQNAEREQERLEALVKQRTAALEARNADLGRVLENVDEGLVLIDRDGKMSAERSAILERWLGPAPASLWQYLAGGDAEREAWLEASWSGVLDDVLPRELALTQMPQRVENNGRTYALAFSLITSTSDEITGALAVVSDVSDVVARELAEVEERESMRLIGRLVSDRDGIIELLAEGAGLMATILERTTDRTTLFRALHTLKGSAAQFGIESISQLCHAIETRLVESGAELSDRDRETLEARWSALSHKLSVVMGTRATGEIRVDLAEYEALRKNLRDPALLATVDTWRHERVAPRFERHASSARALAERLGQPPLRVTISAAGVRVPAGQLAAFWPAFTHLVRNAVDHGARDGEPGHLELSASRDRGGLTIVVRDHGHGIAWSRVAQHAAAAGLPHRTHADLVEALFYDGLSTRANVSEVSGRGVGLSAVRAACAASGGTITVDSDAHGTAFRVYWPARALTSIAPPRARPSIAPKGA